MGFEWDEAKRLANLTKHKLDFKDAVTLFDDGIWTQQARYVGGEFREMGVAQLDDALITVIYVKRADMIRIISMRRAHRGERRKYRALFGG